MCLLGHCPLFPLDMCGKLSEYERNLRAARVSPDDVVDWALELAREGWQDRGYFAAQVSGDARTLTSNAVGQRIVISVRVDEGPLYSLGEITFKHNKAISDSAFLRRLFPIERGDILSRTKIANGLDNLKKAYGELGYINFTTVPTPTIDDQSRIVSFDIDLDEGKQFRIRSLNVLGVDEPRQHEILSAFPIGQTYDERMFREFLKQHSFEPDDPWLVERHLDERTGAVAITLNARPCVSD